MPGDRKQALTVSRALGRDARWHTDLILDADRWAPGSAEELLDGTAWTGFCRALQLVGHRIRSPEVPSDLPTVTDGYRSVATYLKNALEVAVDELDPELPRLRWYTGRYKVGYDCPDALYGSVNLQPGARYRLRGRRGTARFLGLQVMAQVRSVHNTWAGEWEIGADGRFELVLGPTGDGRPNTIALGPDADKLLVRQFFYDWEHEEPARLEIERLDPPSRPGRREPLDPGSLARTLAAVVENVGANIELWSALGLQRRADRLNRFTGDGFGTDWGAQSHQFAEMSYFRVAPDEALIIETDIPEAVYWSFSLCNFWAETLEAAAHQSSLNGHQAALDGDGRFRAVVAHRDPGIPNWLDPVGHVEGTMVYRWNLADRHPVPTTRLVPLDALHRHLPRDTPHVAPGDRRQAIVRRRRGASRRTPY
jgi:hypothetical protein